MKFVCCEHDDVSLRCSGCIRLNSFGMNVLAAAWLNCKITEDYASFCNA